MYQLHAQYTTIPDAVFEQFLINQRIDSEGTLDGQVLTSDVAMVYSLDIPYTISDITGIQDFTALTYLKTANITALDVSGLTVLQELDLSINTGLQTLNVTGCTGLRNLNIKLTSLDTLDLSTCTSLETIEMYKCTLRDLDLHGLTSLVSISANESYLATLNVTGCTSLAYISITETSIHSLNLSNNPSIINLSLFDCFLRDLNLINCTNLESLFLYKCGSLSNIELSNCTSLRSIDIEESLFEMTSLDMSSLTALERVVLFDATIQDIDLTNNTNLTTLGIQFSSVSSLDLRNGHNTDITIFGVLNTDLDCINVDDEVYSTANWTNDNNTYVFSNDCQTLSTTENQINTISMYPNPVINNLNIGLQNHQILQEVTLVNLQGKKMLTSTSNTVDVSHLSSGYYFAMIHTNQGKSIKKILKK
jgi:hypothetical protein